MKRKKTPEVTFDFGEGAVRAHQHPNGGGWVADTARVDPSVYVGPDARVFGHARVEGLVRIKDRAQVCGEARVEGYACVGGAAVLAKWAYVGGRASIYGSARLDGEVRVVDCARICGSAVLWHDVRVGGDAYVGGAVYLGGNVQVGGTAWVEGSFHVGGNAIIKSVVTKEPLVLLYGGTVTVCDDAAQVRSIFVRRCDPRWEEQLRLEGEGCLSGVNLDLVVPLIRAHWRS